MVLIQSDGRHSGRHWLAKAQMVGGAGHSVCLQSWVKSSLFVLVGLREVMDPPKPSFLCDNLEVSCGTSRVLRVSFRSVAKLQPWSLAKH